MLKAEHISFAYNNEVHFQFPDLLCNAGEHWLILGASGSGKTTWLHILAGILTPSKGVVNVGETSIYELSESERDQFRGKHFGIVFQQTHLIRSISIVQNLQLTGTLIGNKISDQEITSLLADLKLEHRANAKPGELSTGELQRAGIARALINQPDWILADEPTSSLDDQNATAVIDLLEKAAKERGAGLIVVTHDQRIRQRFTNTKEL